MFLGRHSVQAPAARPIDFQSLVRAKQAKGAALNRAANTITAAVEQSRMKREKKEREEAAAKALTDIMGSPELKDRFGDASAEEIVKVAGVENILPMVGEIKQAERLEKMANAQIANMKEASARAKIHADIQARNAQINEERFKLEKDRYHTEQNLIKEEASKPPAQWTTKDLGNGLTGVQFGDKPMNVFKADEQQLSAMQKAFNETYEFYKGQPGVSEEEAVEMAQRAAISRGPKDSITGDPALGMPGSSPSQVSINPTQEIQQAKHDIRYGIWKTFDELDDEKMAELKSRLSPDAWAIVYPAILQDMQERKALSDYQKKKPKPKPRKDSESNAKSPNVNSLSGTGYYKHPLQGVANRVKERNEREAAIKEAQRRHEAEKERRRLEMLTRMANES